MITKAYFAKLAEGAKTVERDWSCLTSMVP